jgi:hypothetical protein
MKMEAIQPLFGVAVSIASLGAFPRLGREPIKPDGLAKVRFGAHRGLNSDIA